MKLLSCLIILVLAASLVGAQTSRPITRESKLSAERCRCGSLIVELASLNTKLVRGKIGPDAVTPILIEIYSVPRGMWKKDSYLLTKEIKARRVFQTDMDGNFFLPSLKMGRYVFKFGIAGGGMNCAWMKVRLSKKYIYRPIEAGISVGI